MMKSSRRVLSLVVLLGLLALLVFAASPAGAQAPHPLVVKKEAFGTQTTTWRWTIEKSADPTGGTVTPGESFDVNYTVTVSADDETVWTAYGNFTIRNTSGADVTVDHVVDTLSDGTVATITRCRYFAGSAGIDIALPYLLPPTPDPINGVPKIVCDYQASGTGTPPDNNTAVAYTDATTVGGEMTRPVAYSPAETITSALT
jgi:hypothetical protein